MNTIKGTARKVGIIMAVAVLLVSVAHAQQTTVTVRRLSVTPQPVPTDLQPISYEAARLVPRWLSAQFYGTQPPLPVGCVPRLGVDLTLYYSPSANAIFIGDQNVDYSALEMDTSPQLSMRTMDPADDSGGQTLDTSALWLQITNMSDGLVRANL